MDRAAIAEARVFDSWSDYQQALIRAIAPLTLEQLQHAPFPLLRSPGAIAMHIVYGRALHLHRTLGDAVVAVEPFLEWCAPDAPQQSAADIVRGLELTWQAIAATLQQGTATDTVADAATTDAIQTIWGLLDHDLPHAGELSLLLGAAGLAGVEI